jgi:hypothetical protein
MSIQEINERHLARVREIYREYDERVAEIDKQTDEKVDRIMRKAMIAMTVLVLVPVTLLLVALYAAAAMT